MKLLIPATAVTLFATSALAGQSTRYEDLRLDTALSGAVHAAGAGINRPDGRPDDLWLETFDADTRPDTSLSTRSQSATTAHFNTFGGYGPGNDSR